MADEYMMLVDGKLTQVDMGPVCRRFRAGAAGARAAPVTEVADALSDPVFDPRDMWDSAVAAGFSDDVLDSAGYLSVILARIERDGYCE